MGHYCNCHGKQCPLARLREYGQDREPYRSTGHNVVQSESDLLWHSIPYHRRAAVLIILYQEKTDDGCDNLSVVLTVRSSNLRTFAGHTAFPGGRCDSAEEGPWETALREAKEEIGFDPVNFGFERLCMLPCFLSRNHLVVRPCVCVVGNHGGQISLRALSSQMNPSEVELTYSTQLRNFVDGKAPQFDVLCAHDGKWEGYRWIYYEFEIFRQKLDDWVFSSKDSPLINEQSNITSGLTSHIAVDCARIAFDRKPSAFPALEQLGFENLIRQLLIDNAFHQRSKKKN